MRHRTASERAAANRRRAILFEEDKSYEPIPQAPPPPMWDDDSAPDGETTYQAAEPGPEPIPSWVITSGYASQADVGPLKSGKEATCHLVERRHGEERNLLVAKRYRHFDDRLFRDDSRYRGTRTTGDARMDRAIARGTRRGMVFRGREWAMAEFAALSRLWSRGIAVPYPVQLLGTEVMMEYLGDEVAAAPRLAMAALDRPALEEASRQVGELLVDLAEAGVVHGDLSPYNLLWWQDRVWVIDLPQAVDPLATAEGLELLERDARNVCTWFTRRGVPTDAGELLARAHAVLWGGWP